MSDTLAKLAQILADRKANADPSSSYVAQLHSKGINKILEKVGEEAFEAVLAAKDTALAMENVKFAQDPVEISQNTDKLAKAKEQLIYETADLWFHILVMFSHLECNHDEILTELARRFELSGLTEKAQRKTGKE